MNLLEKQRRFSEADIYPVITEKFCAGRKNTEVLRAVLDAGVRVVQFREKDAEAFQLFKMAEEFRKLTEAAGALLMVNDRIDIAVAVGADGVHLGQSDIPCSKAARIWPQLLIGVSTHNPLEIQDAIDGGAGVINIGPIFSTQTKERLTTIVGLENLSIWKKLSSIPFSVMGGIKETNIADTWRAGARIFAMVTEITMAENIPDKIRRLREIIHAEKEKK